MGVLKQPSAPAGVKGEATLGLKHLTASSQRNRDALIAARGLAHLPPLLQSPDVEAQYNTARILRHLAMGPRSARKQSALRAITALVQALKVRTFVK